VNLLVARRSEIPHCIHKTLLIFLYRVDLSSYRLSINTQPPIIYSHGSFHAGHARQQLHSTRGRGVQTQTDKKQALTITTSNLHITQITIKVHSWSHGFSASWNSIIRSPGSPSSVKKGVGGPCVHVSAVAANFLYSRVGFQVRVAVQAC
jgi:hypothetical protein